MAALFDLKRLEVSGQPVAMLDGVGVKNTSASQFALSETGSLVYLRARLGAGALNRLLVVHMDGGIDEIPLSPRLFGNPRWSPDGSSIAYFGGPAGRLDIYTYDVILGSTPRQLTFEGDNLFPVWSPDGARVAFSSGHGETDRRDLFWKTVNDDSPVESVLRAPGQQDLRDWPQPDLLVFENIMSGAGDLWMFTPESGGGSCAVPRLGGGSRRPDRFARWPLGRVPVERGW